MRIRKVKKRYLFLIIMLAILISSLLSLVDGEVGKDIGEEYSSLVLRNVNIISMKEDQEEILTKQLLYINDGIIKRIESDSGQFVKADLVIDAQGKYLIPGLIDAHTHFFDVKDLPQTISYGVTSVRIMSGFPMHLRWREKIKAGSIVGPSMVISTPAFNSGDDMGPFHLNADKVDIASEIKSYKEKGYDLVKVYSGLRKNHLKEIFSAAKKFDINVAGHLPGNISDVDAFLVERLVSVEHIEPVSEVIFGNKPDSSSISKFSDRLLANNIAVVPTMTVIRNNVRVITEGDDFINMHDKLVNPLIKIIFVNGRVKRLKGSSKGLKDAFINEYEQNQIILKGLRKNKITIVAGTDTGPIYTVNGLSLLEELETYVENEFSNYEALETATRNAAKLLGYKKSGQIARGYNAELVLLNANPLDDIKAIYNRHSVITKQKYFNSKALNDLLTLAKDKTGYYRTVVRLLDSLIGL